MSAGKCRKHAVLVCRFSVVESCWEPWPLQRQPDRLLYDISDGYYKKADTFFSPNYIHDIHDTGGITYSCHRW